jgi:pimeloyl-ACP methyl ester carboxylesterase
MARIKIGDVTLNVVERGSGPVLLLVHGFPLDQQMWRLQLDEFSSTHRVIAPDLRGFGQSDVTPGNVTMRTYADDLAQLLDELQIRELVALCGLSMGGYIAWQFALQHGQRLGKLILCDTKAVADTAEGAKGRLDNAQKVLAEGPQALIDGLIPKLFAPQTIERQPDIVKAMRKVMLDTKAEGIAAALRGMAERPDVTPQLASINVPALVIGGEHDAIATLDEMRAFAGQLPQGRFVSIPHAGHMAPLENAPAVNAALRDFLAT